MSEIENKAFYDGWLACSEGAEIDENPHGGEDDPSELAFQWRQGWRFCQREMLGDEEVA